jgi:DNA-binding Lrp family transcriptional regulator
MSDVLKNNARLGLERSFIYYLESQGFIHPDKERKGKVEKRYFSPGDVEKITKIWEYVQKDGMSPRKAYERLQQEELKSNETLPKVIGDSSKDDFIAFMLIRSELSELYTIFKTLTECKERQEAAVVFGDWDIILRLSIDNLASLHSFFAFTIRDIHKISRAKTFIAIDPKDPTICWSEPSRHQGINGQEKEDTVAYIFIETKDDGAALIRGALREKEEVISAVSVYGEANIIAKVAVKEGLPCLNEFIDQTLRNHPAVMRTNTFPVLNLRKGYLPLEFLKDQNPEKN